MKRGKRGLAVLFVYLAASVWTSTSVGETSKLAMWSWLSYDFDLEVPGAVIVNKLDKQLRKGDILVFHENEHTANRLETLLPRVVGVIRKKGLAFKTFPK